MLSRLNSAMFIVALSLLALLLAACGYGQPSKPAAVTPASGTATADKLPPQQFAAHYVDSAPVHGKTFALVPDKVLINFDFSLAEPSSITVTKDGASVQTGKTAISGANSLHLSATLPGTAGDGIYLVKYKACWPDRSCHDGQFSFTVDSRAKASYVDITGKSDVALDMKDLRFLPASIIISKGTKVTWTNREASIHFVNTDPHPSHNNLPDLNSLELRESQSYSYTFNQPGEWAYHCSAHFPLGMTGSIIVQ